MKFNVELSAYNTMHVAVRARYLDVVEDVEGLKRTSLAKEFRGCIEEDKGWMVLGKGSNVLFTRDFPGFIIINRIEGIRKTGESEDHVYAEAGAGVNWDDFVSYCLENNWGGVENLIRIPGTVGAAPVQNIGAYGVEVSHCIDHIKMLYPKTGETEVISGPACNFGYRNSIFKHELKGEVIITSVAFRLDKNPVPVLTYEPVLNALDKRGIKRPSIQEVAAIVSEIRNSKLPDPEIIGNCGSFFKNPIVDKNQLSILVQHYPEMKYHQVGDAFKIYAGWLLEKAGWKGYRQGQVGCYEKQALVLVNYGNASGKEVDELATRISSSVYALFGIRLEREVQTI